MTEKYFTLGPVEMFDYTRERLGGQLPYFRTEAFSQVMLECVERLKRLAGAPDGTHVYLLTCSGTGAMEAAIGGCFTKDDRVLVVDGGGFGRRFVEIADHHRIPNRPISLVFGETLELEMLNTAAREAGNPTALFVNLHETTTGQLYDKDMLAAFCRAYSMYFVCDAISSFLTDPINFEKDGMDALILSSQKALALPPGLAVVLLSDRLYRKIIEQDIRPFSLYFDFRDAEANAVRGQTPFTPAVGTILALRDRLERLEAEGGVEASVARTKALAEDFRMSIKVLIDRGLIALPGYPLSNACTPILFPKGNAKEVFLKLSQEYGIWVNPIGGALADTELRIGHLGDLTVEDGRRLAGSLEMILH